MLRFLIYAWQWGLWSKRRGNSDPYPYQGGNNDEDERAFKRTRKSRSKTQEIKDAA